jgi:MFS family permease
MPALGIYTACLAAIASHGFYTAVRLALALLVLKLTQAPAMVGMVMMAYALLPALLAPHIGRAADRLGVRPLLHACLALLAVCGLALWWLPQHMAVLTAAAALVGLGFNAFAISIQKLIGALPPVAGRAEEPAADRRKRNFGTLATASSISSFAGPLLAGWGMDHLGPGAVFGLLTLLPLAAWALSLGWRIPPPSTAPVTAAPAHAPATARSPLFAPEMRPLALAIVMLTVAGDALSFLAPVIGRAHGLSATEVGGIVSAFAVGAFVIRLASGLFIARLREWTYLWLTLLASALLLLVFAQLASASALMAVSVLLGAWLGLAQPMTQSLLHRAVPEHRVGEALGSRLALVGAAQAASPVVLGFGAQALGTATTLALASAVLAVCGVLLARAPVR